MATVTTQRADTLVAELRRGMDLDGQQNPAGPLFADGYTEHEITMTGGGMNPVTGPETNLSWWEGQGCQVCCWV